MPPTPQGFRIHRGARLALSHRASVVATSFVNAYVLYDDGVSGELEIPDFASVADRVAYFAFSSTAARMDGWIVGGTWNLRLGGVKRGQLYGKMSVWDGQHRAVILKGYLYDYNDLAIGEFVEAGPGGGEGYIRTVTGSNPAAGAEANDTVPANALWRLIDYSIVLVTDGNAANREPRLLADDGTSTERVWGPAHQTTTQAASLTRTWIWQQGRTPFATAGQSRVDTETVNYHESIPPNLFLPEGYRLRTVTQSIQATDNYATPIFHVEEWLVV